MTTSELLTVNQAAAELSMSPRAVQRRIKAGSIRANKFGDGRTSAWAITREEISRLKADAGRST